jgi:hypothetical protein
MPVDEHIQQCIDYLLSLNDVAFNDYIDDTTAYTTLTSNDVFTRCGRYAFDTCIKSYLMNETLIYKCIDMNVEAFNIFIRYFTKISTPGIEIWNIDMIKYLHNTAVDMTRLLQIAVYNGDYRAIKYIIDEMTIKDLYNVIDAGDIRIGLANILIIDKIHIIEDYALQSYYKDKILEPNNTQNDNIILCYFIIFYSNIIEGKKHVTIFEANYKYRTIMTFSKLLQFHFRDRGAYTKAARINY